jgi:hypothetical protein
MTRTAPKGPVGCYGRVLARGAGGRNRFPLERGIEGGGRLPAATIETRGGEGAKWT